MAAPARLAQPERRHYPVAARPPATVIPLRPARGSAGGDPGTAQQSRRSRPAGREPERDGQRAAGGDRQRAAVGDGQHVVMRSRQRAAVGDRQHVVMRGRRGVADGGPVVLTRRGRIAVTGFFALMAAGLLVALPVGAHATGAGVSPARSEQNLSQVSVRPGDTLWSIAVRADPSADPRVVIQRITDLNALAGAGITPGQTLWVPKN